MKRPLLALTALLLAVGVLIAAGCGGSDSPSNGVDESVPFDRAFIDGMVPHHEQAIEMAKDAKAAGLSEPVLVDIADSIITSQGLEIDQMKRWRQDWFGSSTIDPNGADSMGMSMDDMGMTDSPMDFGSANDVDESFATMMVAHHEGAIKMAELARDKAEHQAIKDLAREILTAQQDEIDLMRPYAGDAGDDMGGMGGMGG